MRPMLRWMILWLIVPFAAPLLAEDVVRDQGYAEGVIDVRFKRVGQLDGMSQPNVRSITQDNLGFVWFGTRDGLNRYDGQVMRVFRHNARDATSISDNIVSALAADRDKQGIWVGTRFAGVDYFDPLNETFESIDLNAVPPMRSAYNEILMLFTDSKNRLWISRADGGFLMRDSQTEKVVAAPAWPQASGITIGSMIEIEAGHLIFAASNGVFRYKPDESLLEPLNLPTSVEGKVLHLAYSNDHLLWLGTDQGQMYCLDRELKVICDLTIVNRKLNPVRENQVIRSLAIDQEGSIWVATNVGLSRYEPQTRRLRQWRANPEDPKAIASDRFTTAKVTRDGSVWFGTSYDGAVVYVPGKDSFIEIQPSYWDLEHWGITAVSAQWQDADGTIWLGLFDGGGLVHFDLHKGILRRWAPEPNQAGGLASDRIRSILRSSQGELWIGTAAGLHRLSSSGDRFEIFLHDANNPKSLPSNKIEDLFEDAQGNLWVSTSDKGVAMRCRVCRDFRRYPISEGKEAEMNYLSASISETRDGMIWVSLSNGGITRLDPISGKITRLRHDPKQRGSIGFDTVSGVLEDSRGGLWVATHGGGLSYARNFALREIPQFESITSENGLDSDVLTGVIEDVHGKIWVSSARGLNRIDPESKEIIRFEDSDGAIHSGYFVNALELGIGGNLLFGSPVGLTLVSSPEVIGNDDPPMPLISDVILFGSSAFYHNDRSPLDKPASFATRLKLPQKSAFFTIRLASLGFRQTHNLRYAYRMKGQSDQWVELPRGSGEIVFSGMAAGNYQLSFRAAGPNGRWIQGTQELQIEIQPPWWRSTWAFLCYAFGSLLALAWIFRTMQLRQIHLAKQAEEGRLSKERLTLAMEASGGEMWDMEPQSGKVVRDSPLSFYSVSKSDKTSMLADFAKDLHPEDEGIFTTALVAHMKGKAPLFQATYRVRGADGKFHWLFSRGKVVERNELGKATRLLGTTQDITPLKEREESLKVLNEGLERRVNERTNELSRSNVELLKAIEELRVAQQQLVESEKLASLGSLVAGVAHEINTPLGVGVTAASHLQTETAKLAKRVLESELSTAEISKFTKVAGQSADIILKNLQRADKLVKSFKQVAVDQSSEDKRMVTLMTYLDEVVTSLNPALRKSGHVVNLSGPENLVIESFPGAIYQVVANLVMNAHLHAFEGRTQGEVQISLRDIDEDKVEIMVADNGIGMEESVRKRIFEPFFTTKRGRGGSGLGLHIVYSLVTQMLRGRIDCESKLGTGTRFIMRLPKSLNGNANSKAPTEANDTPKPST